VTNQSQNHGKFFCDIIIQFTVFLPSFCPSFFAGLQTENYIHFSTKFFSSKIGKKTSLSWLQSSCGYTTSSSATCIVQAHYFYEKLDSWTLTSELVQGSIA